MIPREKVIGAGDLFTPTKEPFGDSGIGEAALFTQFGSTPEEKLVLTADPFCFSNIFTLLPRPS
jgi:hypothetical protein